MPLSTTLLSSRSVFASLLPGMCICTACAPLVHRMCTVSLTLTHAHPLALTATRTATATPTLTFTSRAVDVWRLRGVLPRRLTGGTRLASRLYTYGPTPWPRPGSRASPPPSPHSLTAHDYPRPRPNGMRPVPIAHAQVYAHSTPKLWPSSFGYHELWHLLIATSVVLTYACNCSVLANCSSARPCYA